jgi:hypothetical protein
VPGSKLQAASVKQQASSSKLLKVQAASVKPQAASIKLQATRAELFNIFSFVKFLFSILVHKILGVNAFHSFQNLLSGFKVTTTF